MNIYQALNKVISYIEENLDQEIDYNHIAKIMGTNKDTAKRLFFLTTNISLSKYIKKRRLSKAAYDIECGKDKLINIALKYGYENPSSFSRAFKSFHGKLPSDIKSSFNFTNFPPLVFKEIDYSYELKYTIKNLDTFILYGLYISVDTNKISEEATNFWYEFNKNYKDSLKYGIVVYDQNNINKGQYWICLPYKFKNSKKIIINHSKYMSVICNSKEASEISKLSKEVYKRNLPATDYKLTYAPDIEIYKDNQVEILLPIK